LESLLPILTRHHEAQKNETLLTVPFVTVNEYLWLLKGVSEVMGGVEGVGRKGLFYLAAAVSDFFLPEDKMVSLYRAGITWPDVG
jgi:phosphopantothenate-cysteine ligase